jgi:hypothetical protein
MSAAQHNKIRQRRTPTWLQRLSAQDRKAVDAVVQWIKPVPWQWFITLTFPWNVHWQTAVKKLRQFAQRLEEHMKARVCFVAGQESRPAQVGMNVPHHFHMLLIGQGVVTKEAIEASWNRLVSWEQAGNEIKDNVRVKAYDPSAPGAEYCLKWLNDDHSDWHFHNLEHFLPGAPGPSKPNHRTVRAAKRAKLAAERIESKEAASD